MKSYIAPMTNYTVAAVFFILAIIYLVKPSFMPYHSQALSLQWNEVDTSTQSLLLALMRVCGGGWFAVSLAIVLLQFQFSHSRQSWIPDIILVIGLTSTLSTLYATSIVYLYTPGRPPIPGLFFLIFLLLIGNQFNKAELRKYHLT